MRTAGQIGMSADHKGMTAGHIGETACHIEGTPSHIGRAAFKKLSVNMTLDHYLSEEIILKIGY